MGLDIFVQCFSAGEPAQVPTQDLLACFSGFIESRELKWLELRFGPQDSCTLYLNTEAPTATGFMIGRPCRDPRLADCVFRFLRLSNVAIMIPGENHVIVSSEAAIEELPPDLLESFRPVVPTTPQEFRELFFPV